MPHLITSSRTPLEIKVSNITVTSEEKVILLGIYIDSRLNFDYHVSQFYKKAGTNSSFQKYMNISQCKLISNAFVMPQFSRGSLIVMFYNRAMEPRINRIHERAPICPN